MLRFKQFSGSSDEIEAQVNAWLDEFEPDVTQMVQTVGPLGGITLSFLFEESFRGQERRLSQEHGVAEATTPAVPPESFPDTPIQVPQEPGTLTPRSP